MKLTKRRAALAAALVSVFAFTDAPAQAVGSTPLIVDGSGVDYDAACVLNTDLPPAGPNAVGSPGTSPCQDGSGISTYDGRTESTDIHDVALSSNTAGQLIARCTLDEPIMRAGTVPAGPAAVDVPDSNVFTGASCKVMFQNKNEQTNRLAIGCTRIDGTPMFDVHGAWQDGFHFFVGFSQSWDGTKWVHSAQIGEYDPAPDGGFAYYELATDDGSGWSGVGTTVAITGGTVTITTGGRTLTPNPSCVGGVFRTTWALPGDVIANVKGLSSADTTTLLPTTVPGFGLVDDVRSVGGYTWFSDTTVGNSTPGMANTNMPNIAYTTGAWERARGGSTMSQGPAQAQAVADGRRTCCDPVDTLGEGPTCPTPTFGGVLPANPMFTPGTACHIDDDSFSRGSILPEFWDTPFGFVF